MLKKIMAIFAVNDEVNSKLPADSGKCLVEIELAGNLHTFYQDLDFIDCLSAAMKTSKPGDFLVYSSSTGSYAINLDYVGFINIPGEVIPIASNDALGYSVLLAGKSVPIILGELSADQVSEDFTDSTQQFIKLGSHYFNRAEVVFIVCKGGEK